MQLKNSCIYFLLDCKRVVYIGQTTNLKHRINCHRDKKFDSFRSINCESAKLDHYERRLIAYFKPYYNRAHNPIKTRPEFIGRPKIHKTICISQLAIRYYAITRPGKVISIEQARKNYFLDNKIDEKVVIQVLKQAFNEQKKMLKKYFSKH